MKLQIATDLSKIAVKSKIKELEINSYNLICVLLDKDNKIYSSDLIVDRNNRATEDGSILLEQDTHGDNIFNLNLEKVSECIQYITFLMIGNPTGSFINGVQSVKVDLMDLRRKVNIATLKMSIFSDVNKCISICTFIRCENGWLFREVCKDVRLDDFNLL